MKIFGALVALLLSGFSILSAQYCNTSRYDTTFVFSAGQIQSATVVYGHNTNWLGTTDTLRMTVFYPKNNVDTATKRPFIMLVHGGGFVGGSRASMDDRAEYFARMGFVAATLDYRLGWSQTCDSIGYVTNVKAIYRAVQDQKAALRYVVAHASQAKVDTNYLFLFGRSAGAVTCLNTVFTKQSDFNAALPGISAELGGLETGTNNLTVPYTVKSVGGVAGAIPDTSLITTTTMIPVAVFQGTADSVVPYETGYPYNCTSLAQAQGSLEIARRIEHLNGCYLFCYQPGVGHGGVYDGQEDFLYSQLSHFYKRTLCNQCTQLVYEDETLVGDTALGLLATAVQEEPVVQQETLSLFPNPAADQLYLSVDDNTVWQVTVYDALGHSVYRGQMVRNGTLNVQSLAQGVYVVALYNPDTGISRWKVLSVRHE